MAGTQQIKRKILSAESLLSIVGTMKAYASANIQQYQNAAQASMTYKEILDLSFFAVLKDATEIEESLQSRGKRGTIHIVFGSDHGLAGRYNENIANFASEQIRPGKWDRLILIGQQVKSRLEEGFDDAMFFHAPQSLDMIGERVQDILLHIEDIRKDWEISRESKGIREMILYYNMPDQLAFFSEKKESIYPVNQELILNRIGKWPGRSVPACLISPAVLFSDLLRQYFFIALYRTFCYSLASENASRLSSMQAAEKNIKERLEDLQSNFRKQRQNDITEELLDIISGFKAIERQGKKGLVAENEISES